MAKGEAGDAAKRGERAYLLRIGKMPTKSSVITVIFKLNFRIRSECGSQIELQNKEWMWFVAALQSFDTWADDVLYPTANGETNRGIF